MMILFFRKSYVQLKEKKDIILFLQAIQMMAMMYLLLIILILFSAI